jgi:tetratricopeptide (TPR) repeat protein
VQAHAARLEQSRLGAVEERIDVELTLGRHGDVIEELRDLTAVHPLRERLWAQLMLALYRCGRRAEALDAYRHARRLLVDDLGVEPGPQLQQLHRSVLVDDPQLAGPQPAATVTIRVAPAQLPADSATFVGRTGHLRQLDLLVDGNAPPALVVGAAGVGKTALVVHWAHRVRPNFPDGQLFINLQGYAPSLPLRPIDALSRLLPALGATPEQIPADLETAAALYRSLLADRSMLIVLDNAAHADQVRPLLPGSPRSLALVTSRDQLTGLVALDSATRIALDVLPEGEAHALLTRILGAGKVGAEPQATIELSELCGRMPLALRIAAARVMSGRGSIAAYAEQLRHNRLDALEIDDDPQCAVRTALDRSYTELPDVTRDLFRLLGLWAGPDFTAAAAAALARLPQVTTHLRRLAAGHLVDEHAPGRYTMHDLVRCYAAERCHAEIAPADRDRALDRLYSWCLDRIDAAAELLYPEILRLPRAGSVVADFETQAQAVDWLDAERSNLVAMCQQAGRAGFHPMAWRLADAMRGYLHMRRFSVDWAAVAEVGLAAATVERDDRALAAVHLNLASLHFSHGRYQASLDHGREAHRYARSAHWANGESAALGALGIVHTWLGQLLPAAEELAESLAIARESGWSHGEATKLINLGMVHWSLGQLQTAVDYQRQAIALHEQGQSESVHAYALNNLGELYHELGRHDDALAMLTAALTLLRRLGNRRVEADTTRALAALYRDLGQHTRAYELARAALSQARETDDQQTEAAALSALASIDQQLGQPLPAIDKYRQVIGIARDIDERYIQAVALIGLADAQRDRSNLRAASQHAVDALAIARQDGYLALEGHALTALAAISLDEGHADHAVSHARHALTIHHETGHHLGRVQAERVMAAARHQLDRVAVKGGR